ncbi:ComEA family DNA-binding protein [Myroides sp. LoEW2-1]|uniref:ComEA family DNA-binding protein n=1 Tax=Myroides sp. LoEW2-1 TaxID=2683192 RepID=UPI0013285B19|nr:helix-hairpin-helix domain-containing protein [Myroides sp. LoEW2-1]MVX34259.1 competence protein ComEA [Myroides sp. LoEW2-1]
MFKSHRNKWYYYTKSQRRGVVVFVILIIIIQLCFIVLFKTSSPVFVNDRVVDMEKITHLNQRIDNIATIYTKKRDTIYPFNPNFISDFKGYSLGMSIEEIDRLLSFRAENKYVNSAQEFQSVTRVLDEWLKKYSVYFKFPDWVSNPKPKVNYAKYKEEKEKEITPTCINEATEELLQKVRGIGPYYASKIVKDREKYGGYVHMDQLRFVYGLNDETISELFKYFKVFTAPNVEKINVNEASINELKKLPYLNYYIAREIVKYRSMQEDFVNKEQLRQIENFPLDKIDIISLYLKFTN